MAKKVLEKIVEIPARGAGSERHPFLRVDIIPSLLFEGKPVMVAEARTLSDGTLIFPSKSVRMLNKACEAWLRREAKLSRGTANPEGKM